MILILQNSIILVRYILSKTLGMTNYYIEFENIDEDDENDEDDEDDEDEKEDTNYEYCNCNLCYSARNITYMTFRRLTMYPKYPKSK